MQALYNLTMPTAEELTLFATITAYFALTDTVRTRSITYSAYRYYDCLHIDFFFNSTRSFNTQSVAFIPLHCFVVLVR